MLKILKDYDVNISKFIRSFIREKSNCEWNNTLAEKQK